MIQNLLGTWKYFNDIFNLGCTPEGQTLIKRSLALCNARFPGYVDEIRGMAAGAEIDFEKVQLILQFPLKIYPLKIYINFNHCLYAASCLC